MGIKMAEQRTKTVRMMKDLKENAQKHYPDYAGAISKKAFAYYKKFCEENQKQTRKIEMHTKEKIYPTISFYKAVLEVTGNQEVAYRFIADYFHCQAVKTNKSLKRLCNIPFLYHVVPFAMTKIIHHTFGRKSGFDRIDFPKTRGTCHIDMTVCPYFSNCVTYGCQELGTVFCDADDVAYGEMHKKLVWGRTKTLARGNECCDFILEIKK